MFRNNFAEIFSRDHQLNEVSAQETRLQMKLIMQMEQQVVLEKARLKAMMAHIQNLAEAKNRVELEKPEQILQPQPILISQLQTDADVQVKPPYTYSVLIREVSIDTRFIKCLVKLKMATRWQ